MLPLKGPKHNDTCLALLGTKELQIHYYNEYQKLRVLHIDSAILTLAKGKYHIYDQRFMYKVVHHSIVIMIFLKGVKILSCSSEIIMIHPHNEILSRH